MAAIRPLNDRIVVKQTATNLPTPGSTMVYVPEFVKSTPNQGVVIAVGPGKLVKGKLVEPVVKVGDTVLFPKGAGTEVVVDKQKFLVMTEDAITGVIANV